MEDMVCFFFFFATILLRFHRKGDFSFRQTAPLLALCWGDYLLTKGIEANQGYRFGNQGEEKSIYTTKEFNRPTKKTNRIHNPRPEKTVPLFSVHPSGEAKATGTPTTRRKDKAINANSVNWNRKVISLSKGVGLVGLGWVEHRRSITLNDVEVLYYTQSVLGAKKIWDTSCHTGTESRKKRLVAPANSGWHPRTSRRVYTWGGLLTPPLRPFSWVASKPLVRR